MTAIALRALSTFAEVLMRVSHWEAELHRLLTHEVADCVVSEHPGSCQRGTDSFHGTYNGTHPDMNANAPPAIFTAEAVSVLPSAVRKYDAATSVKAI